MKKIIIDKNIPYIKGVLENVAKVDYLSANQMTNETIKKADALIIRTRTKCDKELLKGSSVQIIASATIGYDHIDTKYCQEKGIVWKNSPSCNSLSVTQYMASVFSFLEKKKGIKLKGKTVGIVGVGSVGSKVVELSRSFGMKVMLNDPPREKHEKNNDFCSLDEICKKADIITFHPWLDTQTEYKTFHLANSSFFEKLERKPILINTSRGEVVDTKALKKALDMGQISDAIIDCWENEPNIDTELLQKCLLATPHIAGYSADGKLNATVQSIKTISQFFDFGLDNWSPNPFENVEFTEKISSYNDLFLKTYDIISDSEKLKNNPENFESQRSNYPIRREPKAYSNFQPKEICQEFWKKFSFFNPEK